MAKKGKNTGLIAVSALAGAGLVAFALWPREQQQQPTGYRTSWPTTGWRGTDPFYTGNPNVPWRPSGWGSGGQGPTSGNPDGSYNPDSGYLPGYGPGDGAGSYL